MPYHWLDFTPPQPQIAAAPVAYYSTAAHTRHSSLAMTQRYIDISEEACRKVVG